MPAIQLDGWQTDPEPDMDSGQTTVRNMRSKCRCSYVLQFTFRRAVCCVLHRPPSQVIHCSVFSKSSWPQSAEVQSTVAELLTGEQQFTSWNGRRALSLSSTRQEAVHGLLRQTWRPDLTQRTSKSKADKPKTRGNKARGFFKLLSEENEFDNDPSAGSPTETLLRLLLPLNAQVWESSRATWENESSQGPVQIPH